MASVRCSPKKRTRVELPETGRRSEVEMVIGLYAKTGWVVAKEFELSPVYQITVKHQWKPSITYQMQKNVNEFLAQGKLPTYGTSIDQVVPRYSSSAKECQIKVEAEMRKPWQTAIYAAGVENLLASLFMMEEFMKWRAVVEGIEVPPVRVIVRCTADIAEWTVGATVHVAVSADVPSNATMLASCPPAYSGHLSIVVNGAEEGVGVSLCGNTYAIREKLDGLGFEGSYVDASGAVCQKAQGSGGYMRWKHYGAGAGIEELGFLKDVVKHVTYNQITAELKLAWQGVLED
eukprot:s178_g11.t1